MADNKTIVVNGKTYKLVSDNILDFDKYREIRSKTNYNSIASEQFDCVLRINVVGKNQHNLDTNDTWVDWLGERYSIELGKMESDYDGGTDFSIDQTLKVKEELTDQDKQEIIKHIEDKFLNTVQEFQAQKCLQEERIWQSSLLPYHRSDEEVCHV
jgi:hypothetical protein